MIPERQLLQRQLDISWGLLTYHLERLTDDDLHWSPVANRWSVHRVGESWVPDWADEEPNPIPVPTVAWVSWHIDWWWSSAICHLTGAPIPDREAVHWPGGATSTTDRLNALYAEWHTALTSTDNMASISAFPWSEDLGYTMADMCAWVNVELMKNAAEMGQLLTMRVADRQSGQPF